MRALSRGSGKMGRILVYAVTAALSFRPTAVGAVVCIDKKFGYGDKTNACKNYVAKKEEKTQERCREVINPEKNILMRDKCRHTCGMCDCIDDPTFILKKKKKNCAWVAKGDQVKIDKKCNKSAKFKGFKSKVKYHCRIICGTCVPQTDSGVPSGGPSSSATDVPSSSSSDSPSSSATDVPSAARSAGPSSSATDVPSSSSSDSPSSSSTDAPSSARSAGPSSSATDVPSSSSSDSPSSSVTDVPSSARSERPSTPPTPPSTDLPTRPPVGGVRTLTAERSFECDPLDLNRAKDADTSNLRKCREACLKETWCLGVSYTLREMCYLLEYKPELKASDKSQYCGQVMFETASPTLGSVGSTASPSQEPTMSLSSGPSELPSTTPTNRSSRAPTPSTTLSSDSPTISSTSSPSEAPSVSSTSIPSEAPTTLSPTDSSSKVPTPTGKCVTLQEVLIKDNMPPSSSKCTPPPGKTTSSFTFESSQDESQWFEGYPGLSEKYNAPWSNLEQYVFNAKMTHTDSNSKRTWTMRLGTGGNMYSLVGPMGETVSPQRREDSPWIDEVWHSVNSDPTRSSFMIHGAGSYQSDFSYEADKGIPVQDIPFYSPSLGKYCHDEDGECGFVAWPQHGPIGTDWESTVINFNRYKNCGNGVIEYTSVHHNNIGNGYLPIRIDNPLASIRFSNLRDVVVTDKNDGETIIEPHELGRYATGDLPAYKEKATDSLGYVTFAQDLPSKNSGQYDLLNKNVKFIIHSVGCRNLPSDPFGYGIKVIMCRIEPTVEDKSSTRAALTFRGTPKPIKLPNKEFQFRKYGSNNYCRPLGSNVSCRLDENFMKNYKNSGGDSNSIKFTSTSSAGTSFTLPNGVLNWAIEFNNIYSLIYKPTPDSSATQINSLIENDPKSYTISAVRPPGAGGDIHAKNGTPQFNLHIKESGAWWMYFKPDPIEGVLDMAAYVSTKWPTGSTIKVLWHEGMPSDQNTALTHVFGNKFDGVRGLTPGWPLIWIGNANEGSKPRDLNVYNIVTTANENSQGGSHFYRQYLIIDNFDGISERALSWRNEIKTDNYNVKKGHTTPEGDIIDLYIVDGGSIVRAKVGAADRTVAGKICSGSTTPKANSKALFEIICGDATYIGSDPYQFAPDWGPTKAYICSDDKNARGKWTLLGFFPEGACSKIDTGYTFDKNGCV